MRPPDKPLDQMTAEELVNGLFQRRGYEVNNKNLKFYSRCETWSNEKLVNEIHKFGEFSDQFAIVSMIVAKRAEKAGYKWRGVFRYLKDHKED